MIYLFNLFVKTRIYFSISNQSVYYLKNGKRNYSKVAIELNQNGYGARKGNLFTPMTVRRLFNPEQVP